MKIAVIIPFRLREGADFRRAANLEVVQAWWYAHGFEPQIVDDGLEGDAQFNRHRAYNRAVSRNPDAEVFVFTEADMLVHPDQIELAVRQAEYWPGLVVPFTQYRYLSDWITIKLRDDYVELSVRELANWWALPVTDRQSVFAITPEVTMDNGKSIGAINVVSKQTLDITGGFTEATSGNWYDDNIIEEGFAYLTGQKTRHIPGPAVHLYHLPGWKGAHLSEEDRAATRRNKDILDTMRTYIRADSHPAVRRLMEVRA